MYIREPVTLTEQMLSNGHQEDKYKALLNANFQDYLDSAEKTGELKIQSGLFKQKVTALFSTAGVAAGSVFGGPLGMTAGYALGNVAGTYVGGFFANKLYGRALEDMSEIYHIAEMRHTQLATNLAFQRKMDDAIDTLRQNEDKRLKDSIQEMAG